MGTKTVVFKSTTSNFQWNFKWVGLRFQSTSWRNWNDPEDQAEAKHGCPRWKRSNPSQRTGPCLRCWHALPAWLPMQLPANMPGKSTVFTHVPGPCHPCGRDGDSGTRLWPGPELESEAADGRHGQIPRTLSFLGLDKMASILIRVISVTKMGFGNVYISYIYF